MRQLAKRATLIAIALLMLSPAGFSAAMAQGGTAGSPRGGQGLLPGSASRSVVEQVVKGSRKKRVETPQARTSGKVEPYLDLRIEIDDVGASFTGGTRSPGSLGNTRAGGALEPRFTVPDGDAPERLHRVGRNEILAPVQRGTPAPENPSALAVAIAYRLGGENSLCTGTLLDATHVLTAGHCGCGTDYRVILSNKVVGEPGREIEGNPILFDSGICRDFVPAGNDLALLTLKEPADCEVAANALDQIVFRNGKYFLKNGDLPPTDCRFDPANVQPGTTQSFGYPEKFFYDLMPQVEKAGRLTGFGYGYTENGTVGVRMQATIPIRSIACLESRFLFECAPYLEMILGELLGHGLRKDSCRGDSGAPMFLIEEGRYTLVAVTSRGTRERPDLPILKCGQGGIYTIVSRHSVRNWLEANGVKQVQMLTPPQVPQADAAQSPASQQQ